MLRRLPRAGAKARSPELALRQLSSNNTIFTLRSATWQPRGKGWTARRHKEVMQTEATRAATVDEVRRWRREQLTRAGFPPPLAAELADDAGYDLHALIELVERGCRPDLAVRILAPLERPDAA